MLIEQASLHKFHNAFRTLQNHLKALREKIFPTVNFPNNDSKKVIQFVSLRS